MSHNAIAISDPMLRLYNSFTVGHSTSQKAKKMPND